MKNREVFSGIGLGLLVGLIIGLSIAEVSGIILGALTSLLAVFFGLKPEDGTHSNKSLTIGSFSFACVIAICIGLFMRANNVLTPSIANDVKEYQLANFDTAEIKQIILLKKLGIVPQGYTFSKEAIQSSSNTVLMAGDEQQVFLCGTINNSSSLDQVQNAFIQSGSEYAQLQSILEKSTDDPVKLRTALIQIKELLCGLQKP
ncbi:MAG: hypothetical protein ACXWV4_03720 [Flavitalea sp.]